MLKKNIVIVVLFLLGDINSLFLVFLGTHAPGYEWGVYSSQLLLIDSEEVTLWVGTPVEGPLLCVTLTLPPAPLGLQHLRLSVGQSQPHTALWLR